MKSCYLGALIALATVSSVPAKADDLGVRLLAIMTSDCPRGNVFAITRCRDEKATALNAYGIRALLEVQCPTGSPPRPWCGQLKQDFDAATEATLFNKKPNAAKR